MPKCGRIRNACACTCTECRREMGGGGGHLMGAPTNQCRQDISPMCKSPIWTGFDPLDVPCSLQVQNPVIRVLFLIRFPEVLQSLPLTSHKIQLNRAILTMILPCQQLPWGTSNRNYLISAQNRSYSESPESTGTYYTSLERYFRREYNAVEIVANGSVVTEEIQEQVLRI